MPASNNASPAYFDLQMEVVGCPTVCMHCWAQGVPYQSMPLDDIRRVLQQAREFCDQSGLELNSYPMHEVVAHPQAVQVLQLFREIVSLGSKFVDPLPTTGVPLATREDWSELLDGLLAQETTTLFFAFHGVGEVHDRVVNRAGAYDETLLAVGRAQSRGLKVGANVFVTKENVPQIDELAETLDNLGGDSHWEVARYSPVSRVRRYEQSRPDLHDLLPVAEKIVSLSPSNAEIWTNLDDYTEAAYVRRASENGGLDRLSRCGLRTVCRKDLDLFGGDASLYGYLHGNLRKEDAAQVFARAVEFGPVSDDALYFSGEILPTIPELVDKVANHQGKTIYFDAASARYRWLDLALKKQNSVLIQ